MDYPPVIGLPQQVQSFNRPPVAAEGIVEFIRLEFVFIVWDFCKEESTGVNFGWVWGSASVHFIAPCAVAWGLTVLSYLTRNTDPISRVLRKGG